MPTLPHVAVRALAMAQSKDATLTQLADLICQDQSLAANMLRIANSPAYGGSRSIASLQQAVTRLGMQTVAELAVTVCVKGNVFPKTSYKELTSSLWDHALATALFAKEVARQQRRNVESAYLCGLLHRIGMPIVLKAITEVQPQPQPSSDEVLDLILQLHTDVGCKASVTWELPEQVTSAIQQCNAYEEAELHRHVCAIVHLSSALATELLTAEEEAVSGEDIAGLAVLEELCIYPDQLEKLRSHGERIAGMVKS